MGYRRKAVKVRSAGPGVRARLLGALRLLRRPVLTWVLPTIALAAICALGLRWSRYHVLASPRYRVAAPRIALREPLPAWWDKEIEEQINQSCAFANGMSIFDDSLLAKIAEGYRACPWVKQVQWVKKEFPRRVEASVLLRWPAAAVARRTSAGTAYFLVGEDGVRLPKTYGNWPSGLNIPFIQGSVARLPRPGERWSDKSITDAIKIVRLLQSSDVVRKAITITGVDVSNSDGRDPTRSPFRVLAENNCEIQWGRAPDTDKPGELPVEEKIKKLERFILRGNPTSNRELSIRFPGAAVVVRRLITDGDNG